MLNNILIKISHWLIGTLEESEVDKMQYGDEAFLIAIDSCQFKKEYEWNKWNFNRRKK